MLKHGMEKALLASAAAALLLNTLNTPAFANHAYGLNHAASINVNSEGPCNLPDIQGKAAENLVLDVNNNMSSPVFLEIPDIGVEHQVGARKDETFFFDLSQFKSPETAYMVKDASGNVLSNGRIELTDYPTTSISSAALDSILNYSTAYSSETKPQPVYYAKPASSEPQERNRGFVRGYW